MKNEEKRNEEWKSRKQLTVQTHPCPSQEGIFKKA
jgi:hypothetical protein